MDHVRPLASLKDNTEIRPRPPQPSGSEDAMMRAPQIGYLADGRRLHLQDGPIDLIVEAYGSESHVSAAYQAAMRRFAGLLDELCAELPELRRAADPRACALQGLVARRMHARWRRLPMTNSSRRWRRGRRGRGRDSRRDAAKRVARSRLCQQWRRHRPASCGRRTLQGRTDRSAGPAGQLRTAIISAEDPTRGIATSGRHGRSFSLGIADAVTVLARTASLADAPPP